MVYGFLADAVGFIHLAYVSFVLLGQLLILIGIGLQWRWVRAMRFRVVHLAMIAVVALESLGQLICPLTTWENQLRVLAGQPEEGDSFVANILNRVMFCNDIGNDHWIFKSSYISFASLVAVTFVIAPPRRRGKTAPLSPPSRAVVMTAFLGTAGFILLNTAWCMEEFEKSVDDRRQEEHEQPLAQPGGEAARVSQPAKVDRLPVYVLAVSGLGFVGLALVAARFVRLESTKKPDS